jgi:hypothetical protein
MTIEGSARLRLERLASVLEHEAQALSQFSDQRLLDVLAEIDETRRALHRLLERPQQQAEAS